MALLQSTPHVQPCPLLLLNRSNLTCIQILTKDGAMTSLDKEASENFSVGYFMLPHAMSWFSHAMIRGLLR